MPAPWMKCFLFFRNQIDCHLNTNYFKVEIAIIIV